MLYVIELQYDEFLANTDIECSGFCVSVVSMKVIGRNPSVRNFRENTSVSKNREALLNKLERNRTKQTGIANNNKAVQSQFSQCVLGKTQLDLVALRKV